jgi:hypothetical protein
MRPTSNSSSHTCASDVSRKSDASQLRSHDHAEFINCSNDNLRRPLLTWSRPQIVGFQLAVGRLAATLGERIDDGLVRYGFEDRAPGWPLRGLGADITRCANCGGGLRFSNDGIESPDGTFAPVHPLCRSDYLAKWRAQRPRQSEPIAEALENAESSEAADAQKYKLDWHLIAERIDLMNTTLGHLSWRTRSAGITFIQANNPIGMATNSN